MNIYSTRIFLRPLNTNLESEGFDEEDDDFEDGYEDEFDDEWNQTEEGWAYLPSKNGWNWIWILRAETMIPDIKPLQSKFFENL